MLQLKGKRAIVTGGTAGIGKAIAIAYAEQGADVAIFGTNPERAEEVIKALEMKRAVESQFFRSYVLDISNTGVVKSAIEELLKEWEKIDILVNNAGITWDGLLMKMSEEQWDKVLDVNLKSVFNTCQPLIRAMMKAREGSIINISSCSGLTGNAGQVNYSSSKAGMIGFTKSLALEVATRGIRVNCIAPGFIDTRMTEALTDAQKEGIQSQIPMGRTGRPEEIASVALFLASDASSYMTGQVISVDGGIAM